MLRILNWEFNERSQVGRIGAIVMSSFLDASCRCWVENYGSGLVSFDLPYLTSVECLRYNTYLEGLGWFGRISFSVYTVIIVTIQKYYSTFRSRLICCMQPLSTLLPCCFSTRMKLQGWLLCHGSSWYRMLHRKALRKVWPSQRSWKLSQILRRLLSHMLVAFSVTVLMNQTIYIA